MNEKIASRLFPLLENLTPEETVELIKTCCRMYLSDDQIGEIYDWIKETQGYSL